MVKLPDVPVLDLNAPGPRSGGAAASPGRAAAPLPSSAAPRPPGAITPAAVPAPAPAAPTASPAASPPAAPDERANGLDESFDEVLSQTADQSLKLERMADAISRLEETINDMREEMHAGLLEARTASAVAASSAAGNTPRQGDPNLKAQLDAMDETTQRSVSRLGLRLTLVVALQVVAIVALGIVLFANKGGEHAAAPSVPEVTAAATHPEVARETPAAADASDEADEADDKPRKKKKKKR